MTIGAALWALKIATSLPTSSAVDPSSPEAQTKINEAFSAQYLGCEKLLGLDRNKVNVNGGAIALGHPLGATGARITGKAAALLVREGKRYALATQCIGGGQGIATILEAI